MKIELARLATILWMSVAVSIPLQTWLKLSTGIADAAQTPVEDNNSMKWIRAKSSEALCNDFTRAGFFIRRNESSNDWIIFLESGGLCYNTETCNRRFFAREVRDEFEDDEGPNSIPYGSFDPSIAWSETILKVKDLTQVVSPLMTSMECFTRYIEGRDILDTDPTKNSLFYSYNHVLIPYCSSDVWLGEETDNTEAVEMNTSECNCFDYKTPSNQNGCFNFNPKSSNLQFTFRGKIIYQSIIEQLLDDYDMMNAKKIIVAGSSAGGLGAINHAKWTRQRMNPSTELRVLFDSAWFIDFHDGIETVFNGEVNTCSTSTSNNQRLYEILKSNNSACNDVDQFGVPCCISAHCIMTQRNSEGELLYYPKDTPTFALFSIYDIYLLAPGLASVASLDSVEETANSGNGNSGVGVVLDVLRIIGEYGGTMNNTLDLAASQTSFLSYYVTQCFQHIYLVTSTLWEPDGQSVFGTHSHEFDMGMNSFRHSFISGRWSELSLAADQSQERCNSTISAADQPDDLEHRRSTISDALTVWMSSNNHSIKYTDICQGVLCNPECPDKLVLGELTSNNWHIGVKIFVAVLIIGVALVCVIFKMLFMLWLLWLEKKQLHYINSLDEEIESVDHATLQFPDCDYESAISVSCLDLSYSVKFKKLKDEKKDETAPVVLQELIEDDDDSDEEFEEEAKSWLSRRKSAVSENIASAIRRFSNVEHEQVVSASERKLKKQRNITDSKDGPGLSASHCVDENNAETKEKTILSGVSVFFNPGEMVGIMGPSGCGKTTFLDLLTGRRKSGCKKGEIYINGTPIDTLREWYIANTGYVLQLASPYYEELTVRENLTLAAQLKLPKSKTLREKFERIEQVMHVTGLLKQAETKVGGATGAGLSGGQKRRLVIALQLLNLPSVIFLDEPTSGLDATASYELLAHLNKLADSNRTVVLTIHQPRLEIFHMFHQLVLLSDGKISYSDVPEKAYEVFVSALTSSYLKRGLVIPSLVKVHNPADVIMDMLGNPKLRKIITEHYQNSEDPKLVRTEIMRARWQEYRGTSTDSFREIVQHIVRGPKGTHEQSSLFNRLAVLEARASKRVLYWVLFLPFMFFIFGAVLGSTYIQIDQALLVVSGMCVFSTASALFMFPAMYIYFKPALDVYSFEKADGVGRAYDLVLQGFIRFVSVAFLPVAVAVTVIYLLLVNSKSYNIYAFLQILLVNIALNQTWIALLIALICAFPTVAFRLSPVISAVAGFTSGFFIPVGVLHWGYRWMVYINPNYFGLSSVAYFVLSDFETNCIGNQLECYLSSGPYILSQFFFDKINPYLHIVVLLCFTTFYLLLAIFLNWLWHTTVTSQFKRIRSIFRKSNDALAKEFDANHNKYENHFSLHRKGSVVSTPLQPTLYEEDEMAESVNGIETEVEENNIKREEEVREGESSESSKTRKLWKKAAQKSLQSDELELSSMENRHVWRPSKQPRLADLVASLSSQERQKLTRSVSSQPTSTMSKISLQSRQQMLQSRVQDRANTTKAFFEDDILDKEAENKPIGKSLFKEASKRVIADIQRKRKQAEGGYDLPDIVSLYLAKMKTERAYVNKPAPPVPDTAGVIPKSRSVHHSSTTTNLRKRRASCFTASYRDSSETPGTIPLELWCNFLRENKSSRKKAAVETEV